MPHLGEGNAICIKEHFRNLEIMQHDIGLEGWIGSRKTTLFCKKKMHEFAALQSFEVNKLGNSNVLKNRVNQRAQARFY